VIPRRAVLRDYQAQLASDTLDALKTHDRVVVACPTGSGKTVVAMSGILPHIQGRKAWVTHRIELASQAKSYRSDVSVFMAQGGIDGHFDCIVIDEGHHACAAQYREIISQFPNSKILALTATPYRLDGVGLGSCGFSKIVYGPDIFHLTSIGVLCPLRVFVPKSESIKAWSVGSAAQEVSRRQFRHGIMFCRSVDEATASAHALTSLGIPSAVIEGGSEKDYRTKIFQKFERQRIRVLCNHSIFTEGVDIPSVDLVVLNRHTKSRGLWKQMVGRGTRKFAGKTECVVLDLAGNSVVHGSVYDREVFDLHGRVESTEARSLETIASRGQGQDYEHNTGEELKEWTQPPKPKLLIESLQRLSGTSLLRRFATA
jgi:DNA repair protein RadD